MENTYGQEAAALLKGLLPFVQDRYRFESVIKFLEAFDQLGPYRPGDRVELVVNPECPGGWADSKHFLTKGARATVSDLHWFSADSGCRTQGWVLGLVFDEESWIPMMDFPASGQKKGVAVHIPPDRRHNFWFNSGDVRLLVSGPALEQDRDYIDMGQFDMGRF